MKLPAIGLGLGIGIGLFANTNAYPGFANDIPNGFNVPDCSGVIWRAVAHANRENGGPAFNDFGRDFKRLNRDWAAVCNLDSDGDGMTNGEELGDPNCTWTKGSGSEGLESVKGHPGLVCANGEQTNVVDNSLPYYQWLHGILMIMAWVVFAPIGIVLTMVNKTKSPPAVKSWFQLHRAFLTLTVLLTLVAFAVLWAEVGFQVHKGKHRQIGFAVVVGTILQPLGGIMRPHNPAAGEEKSKARLAWEYGHQWFGRILFTLAIAATILGLDIIGTSLDATDVTDGIRYALAAVFTLAAVISFVYVLFIRVDERKSLPTREAKTEAGSVVKEEPKQVPDESNDEWKEVSIDEVVRDTLANA